MSTSALFALAGFLIGLGLVLFAVKRRYDTSYMRKPQSYFWMTHLIYIGAALIAAGIVGLAAWLAQPK